MLLFIYGNTKNYRTKKLKINIGETGAFRTLMNGVTANVYGITLEEDYTKKLNAHLLLV